jgi:crossover junction endodeoxyribonuclease RusA
VTFTLTHAARPMTVNAARRVHHHTRAAHDREWRGVFHLLALEAKVPHMAAITVTVDQELRNRAHVPDVCFGCAPSVKASIDGLVDAGVIDDDDPEHLWSLTFNRPTVTGRDAVTLTIKEAA